MILGCFTFNGMIQKDYESGPIFLRGYGCMVSLGEETINGFGRSLPDRVHYYSSVHITMRDNTMYLTIYSHYEGQDENCFITVQ